MWKREVLFLSLGLVLALGGIALWRAHDPFLADVPAGREEGLRGGSGTQADAESCLRPRMPQVFADLMVNGRISDETAEDLYRQHGAGFQIIRFRYSERDAAYDLRFRLRWNHDGSVASKRDYWVLGACRVGRDPSVPLAVEILDWSPDYRAEWLGRSRMEGWLRKNGDR